METFNICWLAIVKEANTNGASFVKKSVKEFGTNSNFDLSPCRLEYLYKHGALIINLVAQGILKSCQQFPQILQIFNEVISKHNCEIFSLSNGPGIEVVGFVYGFKKHVKAFKDVTVSVATTCKEWKAVSETLITGALDPSVIQMTGDITFCSPSNFHFLPCEMRETALNPEVRHRIQHCDVLLMYKSYEFVSNINLFATILLEIFALMKEDGLLFFFDGKSRMKLFKSLASCGKILFGPQKIKVKDIPCNPSIIKIVGVKPSQEGNVRFALWKKTVPFEKSKKIKTTYDEAIIPNINIQKQILNTLVNNKLEKCSPNLSPFCSSTVDITNELSQNLNSCKSVLNEHIPQNKLTAKFIKERNSHSNEEIESDKSRTMSEISVLSNHSTNQTLLKTDFSTNPMKIRGFDKEDSDCKESSKISKLACIKDVNYKEETTDKSKINVMIEHCEKIISDVEKKIEKLTIKTPSSENFHENCCSYNRKVAHNFYCPSHLPMPCSVLQCCNHSCHYFQCHNEPVRFNCAQKSSISSGNNMPYLLIPLGNEAMFRDTVNKLLNRN